MADLKLATTGNEVPAEPGVGLGFNIYPYKGVPNDRVSRSFRELKPAFTTSAKAFAKGD